MPHLLSIKEAADYLGVSTSFLYQKRITARIPFIRIGRSIKFDIKDLDRYIEECKFKFHI